MSDSEDNSAGSGSDFDDDEDPDKIEVPGIKYYIQITNATHRKKLN